MKGIVLCGGLGTRLLPQTLITNKHLLPIYNRPMVFYPLETLKKAGISEVMVVVSGEHAGEFIKILKNGEEFGFENLVYAFQEKPNGGIADALKLAENFANGEDIIVILGDNTTDANINLGIDEFYHNGYTSDDLPRAHLFLKEVKDPERFGVPTIKDGKIVKIVEKPVEPESNYAVTGLYIYDNCVFDFIRQCKESERGELEITDVNNLYIKEGVIGYSLLDGFWKDAGTFDSLLDSSNYWRKKWEEQKE